MKTRVGISASLLAGCLMALSAAKATTMVSMSLEQLTQASSKIVQGQVVSQVSRWNDDHTQILTITTVEVSQVLKGNAASTVEIEQLGGTVGNRRVFVAGDVSLRPQSEYVLFLEPATDASRFRVVGMTQGAYRLYQDASTHEERVIMPIYSQLPAQILAAMSANPNATLPLDGFHKYVANLVETRIQIPHGLALPVAIVSTESSGVGRVQVYAKTTTDLFPSKNLVIPAGSEVAGEAVLSGGTWTIHWDELNVRGVSAAISAANQEPEGSLGGRSVILRVR